MIKIEQTFLQGWLSQYSCLLFCRADRAEINGSSDFAQFDHLVLAGSESCTLPYSRKPIYRALCIFSLKNSAEYSEWSIQRANYNLNTRVFSSDILVFNCGRWGIEVIHIGSVTIFPFVAKH